ncbi:MAG TPA: amidohydrolase family protein [Gemmataceae bacterium]|nr:amidohydrolase family protein [Gemmataceae bacterium]
MIDMHVHAVSPRLPGVKPLTDVLHEPPETVAATLREEMAAAGITHLLGMGHLGGTGDDPLGIDSTLAIAALLPGLHPIGVADPSRIDTDHLQRVEKQLRQGKAKALKGYLGYLYYGPEHPNYVPYYELAARYRIPFIFHTGDNYSTVAKVRYAHPLLVDEVAVDHREVNFVMAHFGNPWVTDAAEVVYKNENVWADLSGILVGDEAYFRGLAREGLLQKTVERIQTGMEFTERPERFLYGSDWPLAPMAPYRDFVRRIVPAPYRQLVFEDNARALFGLE